MIVTANQSSGSAESSEEEPTPPNRQPKSEGISLGEISTIIGLCVFFFGAGTFADLKDKITGKERNEKIAHKESIRTYLDDLNRQCFYSARLHLHISVTSSSKIPPPWWRQVLDTRNGLSDFWGAEVAKPKPLSNAEAADMATARSNFRAATGFWGALAVDYISGNWSAYNEHSGQFYQATASYLATLYKCDAPKNSCLFLMPVPPVTQ